MMAPADTPNSTEHRTAEAMIALSRRYLREYLTKIRLAVSVLDDEIVWARPNDASNSIGNLMLHLSGNARQWIVSGIGGANTGEVHCFRDRMTAPRGTICREQNNAVQSDDPAHVASRRCAGRQDSR